MLSVIKKVPSKTKSIILIGFILITAITFETSQQLYYIKRYNIAEGITFIDLLITQSKSWFIWILLSYPLIQLIRLNSSQEKNTIKSYFKYAIAIFLLVLSSIFILAIIQQIQNENSVSFSLLFSEYLPFYTFQKFLIFSLGYIAISAIVHAYFANERLLFKVEELNTLKESHAKLYESLRQDFDDKASILNIKIGNKRKIIAVEHIFWIEADDYCVKVHTEKSTYTMRSSLKALDAKLHANFLRVHRNAIVNMKKVKEFNLSNSPMLILENNIQVIISKSNLKEVRQFIS